MNTARLPRIVGLVLLLTLVTGCDFVVRTSVDSAGNQGNDSSFDPTISADGRYVTFWSQADNLVADDTNGLQDVFRRDLRTKTTVRASVDISGGDANGDSYYPSISGDGRYVAFASRADDLVTGDGNGSEDIFVRDLQNATTIRVTVDSTGGDANEFTEVATISDDGRHVAFVTAASDLVAGDTDGFKDVFLRDLDAQTTTWVSVNTAGGVPNGPSGAGAGTARPGIDADGSRVAFVSVASDLVAADNDGISDMFVRDLDTASTTRISVDTAGGEPNRRTDEAGGPAAISADGRFVAFGSFASDLTPSDPNGAGLDVFVRDLQNATTTLASADSGGGSGPSISADGRFVSYQTTLSWVYDVQTDTTTLTSARGADASNGAVGHANISADGRYVVFHTGGNNLVDDDTNVALDVFVRALPRTQADSVTPDTVARGTSETLTVTGGRFLPGAVVSILEVTVDSVTVISETELEVVVTVPAGAATGARHVRVWNPGTGPGSWATVTAVCGDCLTIT